LDDSACCIGVIIDQYVRNLIVIVAEESEEADAVVVDDAHDVVLAAGVTVQIHDVVLSSGGLQREPVVHQ
jgi:hypothetical protein